MKDKRFINSILVDILLQEIALFVSVYLDSKVHIEFEPSQIASPASPRAQGERTKSPTQKIINGRF